MPTLCLVELVEVAQLCTKTDDGRQCYLKKKKTNKVEKSHFILSRRRHVCKKYRQILLVITEKLLQTERQVEKLTR